MSAPTPQCSLRGHRQLRRRATLPAAAAEVADVEVVAAPASVAAAVGAAAEGVTEVVAVLDVASVDVVQRVASAPARATHFYSMSRGALALALIMPLALVLIMLEHAPLYAEPFDGAISAKSSHAFCRSSSAPAASQ